MDRVPIASGVVTQLVFGFRAVKIVITGQVIDGKGCHQRPLAAAFALGGLGISGVPLFNGYISKTLLHEGIVEAIHVMREISGSGLVTVSAGAADKISILLAIGEWVFLFSGGLTFAYMLKLFICLFVEKNRDPQRQEQFDSSEKCMNAVSTAAILGSSAFMVILGMPPVTKRLLAFALGNGEILEFSAFTLENLKGSMISLGIGAVVYLTVVRRWLFVNDSYVNRWPEKLDLEESLYRPALTKWIPKVLLAVASVFGENRILTMVCEYGLWLVQKIAYLFSVSTDGLILGLRRTALKEKKVRRAGVGQVSRLRLIREGTMEAASPILRNFTFALLMTCLGILVILGVLLIAILRITA